MYYPYSLLWRFQVFRLRLHHALYHTPLQRCNAQWSISSRAISDFDLSCVIMLVTNDIDSARQRSFTSDLRFEFSTIFSYWLSAIVWCFLLQLSTTTCSTTFRTVLVIVCLVYIQPVHTELLKGNHIILTGIIQQFR